MRCRPAICKRFSSKVDTPLSGGLRPTAARPSPAEVLPATRGLCASPPALTEGHLCLLGPRQTQEKQAAGLPPASGPRSQDAAVSPLSAPCRAAVLCGAPQCILGQDDTRAREAAPDAARVARRCSQGMGQYLTPQNLSEKRSACPGQLSTRRISTELADALTSYYSTATCPYECCGTSPCLGTRAGPAAGAP